MVHPGPFPLLMPWHSGSCPGKNDHVSSRGYISIKNFDSQLRFVGRLLPERRYWASIDRLSFRKMPWWPSKIPVLFEHGPIDLCGITRALVKDVIKRRMAEADDYQQLIKNKYLSGKKPFQRKVKEGLLAMEYEMQIHQEANSRDVFQRGLLRERAWHVEAARLYFDKYPQELTEAECALLAGVPKPGSLQPLGKPTIICDREEPDPQNAHGGTQDAGRGKASGPAHSGGEVRATLRVYLAHIRGN